MYTQQQPTSTIQLPPLRLALQLEQSQVYNNPPLPLKWTLNPADIQGGKVFQLSQHTQIPNTQILTSPLSPFQSPGALLGRQLPSIQTLIPSFHYPVATLTPLSATVPSAAAALPSIQRVQTTKQVGQMAISYNIAHRPEMAHMSLEASIGSTSTKSAHRSPSPRLPIDSYRINQVDESVGYNYGDLEGAIDQDLESSLNSLVRSNADAEPTGDFRRNSAGQVILPRGQTECRLCQYEAHSANLLKRHLLKEHNLKAETRSDRLQRNQEIEFPYPRNEQGELVLPLHVKQCPACEITYKTMANLRVHLRRAHGQQVEGPLKKKIENGQLQVEYEMNERGEWIIRRNQRVCQMCVKIFSTADKLRSHLAQHHEMAIEPKDETEKREQNHTKTFEFQRNTDGEIVVAPHQRQCNQCTSKFNSTTVLRRHLRLAHGEKVAHSESGRPAGRTSIQRASVDSDLPVVDTPAVNGLELLASALSEQQ